MGRPPDPVWILVPGVVAGAVLGRMYGWWAVALTAAAGAVGLGSALLVHRYRYGRWTP